MGRFADAVRRAVGTFMEAMMLYDEDDEYPRLGIYNNGEILIADDNNVFISNVVDTFVLIHEIHGEPVQMMMGCITAYGIKDVDYELLPVTKLSTWKAIVDNGFIEDLDKKKYNLLRYTLQSYYPIETEVFDLLHTEYPETDLKGALADCHRLAAARWAVMHGADKHYDKLMLPMQQVMAYKRQYEGRAIFRYLYNCEPEDYLVGLEEQTGT